MASCSHQLPPTLIFSSLKISSGAPTSPTLPRSPTAPADSSRRNLCHRPSHCKQNAYQTLVHPLFECASVVRDAYLRKEIDSLERIQRNAARFIAGDYRSNTTGSVRKLLSKLGLPSGRPQLRPTFLYKVVKELCQRTSNFYETRRFCTCKKYPRLQHKLPS